MFPLRDDNPTFHTSFVTYGIIILNILSWVLIQGWGFNPNLAKSICQFGLIPGELFGFVKAGTELPISRNLACVFDGNPNWTTVVTSMFMHGGWFHLIGNMWFLAVFGDNVEDVMGSFRFLIFYLLCGLSAAAIQMIINPASPVPMVGASGAIGGVMGAYAVLFPRAPVHLLIFLGFFITRIVVPAFFMLGYWFILQLIGGAFSSTAGGVAFWAHIGGFLAGIFFLKVFCKRQRIEECRNKRGKISKFISKYMAD